MKITQPLLNETNSYSNDFLEPEYNNRLLLYSFPTGLQTEVYLQLSSHIRMIPSGPLFSQSNITLHSQVRPLKLPKFPRNRCPNGGHRGHRRGGLGGKHPRPGALKQQRLQYQFLSAYSDRQDIGTNVGKRKPRGIGICIPRFCKESFQKRRRLSV